MSKGIKKQPAKRKYTKRAKVVANSEVEFKKEINEICANTPKKELDELEFLDSVVLGIEQMLPDQKSRFMNYIYSRYWNFITLSKLTQ